jgi:hypothetical protein
VNTLISLGKDIYPELLHPFKAKNKKGVGKFCFICENEKEWGKHVDETVYLQTEEHYRELLKPFLTDVRIEDIYNYVVFQMYLRFKNGIYIRISSMTKEATEDSINYLDFIHYVDDNIDIDPWKDHSAIEKIMRKTRYKKLVKHMKT